MAIRQFLRTFASMPRIYTKTGDKGTSALFTGERRRKDDAVFEALGSTDHLSSVIGFAREFVQQPNIQAELETIQCMIQDVQSAIATPPKSAKERHLEKTEWDLSYLPKIEEWTDNHTDTLPPLKKFILPSGGKASSSLHISRAVCRSAERRLVPLVNDGDVDMAVLQFMNRLSSYFFVTARVAAKADGFKETVYTRPRVNDE